MKVLEEFWYGNSNPMERPFRSQRKFDKVFRLLLKTKMMLLSTTALAAPWWLSKYQVTFDNELGIVGNVTLHTTEITNR